MALEKGTGLELKIAELFKKSGYHVTHNIKMKGKSGAEHQIDVLAEFQAPLHTSTIIIEAKSYEANIDKDIVMKLIQIQQDLSVDRAILATTSDFMPGALKTADQYNNIELWNGDKLASLIGKVQLLDTSDSIKQISTSTVKMVDYKVPQELVEQYANESIQKKAKGGFLGRGKVDEKLSSISKILYPYHDVDFESQVKSIEKRGLFKKDKVTKTIRSRTGVDAVTGALIHATDKGLSYDYAFLSKLTTDEIDILYYVSNTKKFEKRSLSALGISDGKISKLVNSLVGKGLLVQVDNRPVTFKSVYTYPKDPKMFVSLMEKFEIVDTQPNLRKIEPTISPSSIATAFSNYWNAVDVKSIDLVYFPYYVIEFHRDDETRRIEVLDGVSGQRQEYLETVISRP